MEQQLNIYVINLPANPDHQPYVTLNYLKTPEITFRGGRGVLYQRVAKVVTFVWKNTFARYFVVLLS